MIECDDSKGLVGERGGRNNRRVRTKRQIMTETIGHKGKAHTPFQCVYTATIAVERLAKRTAVCIDSNAPVILKVLVKRLSLSIMYTLNSVATHPWFNHW